jgi:hypothetical protein
MSIGVLDSSGMISSLLATNIGDSDYDPYYLLQENNETILFLDEDGTQRYLNSLFIEAGSTALKVQILPSNYVLYIDANESRNFDYCRTNGIKVWNTISTPVRWSGCFY